MYAIFEYNDSYKILGDHYGLLESFDDCLQKEIHLNKVTPERNYIFPQGISRPRGRYVLFGLTHFFVWPSTFLSLLSAIPTL
jgi:hypothetical protein